MSKHFVQLRWRLVASSAMALALLTPSVSSAQTAPPGGPPPASTPPPSITLDELPGGFVEVPSSFDRYASGYCGSASCASAEFVRGFDYVGSMVGAYSSAESAVEDFPEQMPSFAYSPRWLEPPAIGDEAKLMAISEPTSSEPVQGSELIWRRGAYVARVTVLGVSQQPDLLNRLVQRLDAAIVGLKGAQPVPSPESQIDQIARQVSQVRQLPQRGRVAFYMLSPAAETSASYWPAPANPWVRDPQAARFIGAPPPPASQTEALELQQDVLRLLGQEAPASVSSPTQPYLAGRYSTGNRIELVTASWPLGWREQLVAAHEFEHSLQDQHFGLAGLQDRMVAQFPEPNSDAAWALSALSNGEAEFMEAQWAQQYLQEGSWDALHAEEEQHLAETDAPPLITAQDRYPYWLGKEFAESTYASGGWGAVNALFANPPVSSRQVLHPDAYWAGVMPLSVEPPTASALASRGWAPLMDDTFGEIGLRAILEPFLGPEAAAASVDGWSGDRYTLLGAPTVRLPLSSPSTVWWYGRPEVLALETVWDDTTASRRFFDGLANSLDVRFGRDTRQISSGRLMWGGTDLQASVELDGTHVRYVVAPDRASLLAVTAPSS